MNNDLSTRYPRLGIAAVPYIFVVPAIIYLAIFMLYPLLEQVYMSFTDTVTSNPNGGKYIGIQNYADLINDPAFYNTLKVTVIYTIMSVIAGVSLGIISALAIDRPFPGRAIARGVLLFGWAVPNVAASLIWLWMFNGQSGIFNSILAVLGFERVQWLTSMQMALPSIVAVTVWQVAPFVMLVVLATLQSVPEEVREAARIDGADRLNVFRNVTWPHILPAVQLCSLLVAVWSIRRFDIIYLLTGGGPLESTATLVVKIRQVAFESHQLGVGSAYGVVGLLLALLLALLHFGVEKHRARGSA